jgi:hypothetical protein
MALFAVEAAVGNHCVTPHEGCMVCTLLTRLRRELRSHIIGDV